MNRGRLWRPAVVAGLLALAVASAGGALTILGPWYFGLKQPSWKPPDWAFGPALTLIFALTAAAGASPGSAAATPSAAPWCGGLR